MEGVRREHLGSAYMEEPRRSHVDTAEEMEVAALGVRGGRRWEPRSTSRPAFMVSKASDAAVWEDLKDINPIRRTMAAPSISTASWRSWTIGG